MNHQKTSIVNRQSTIVHSKGFTLIELLVVMTVIVTLAAFSTISFNNAKMKARDNSRKEDLKTIKSALILWKLDNQSIGYPATGSGYASYVPTSFLSSYLMPFGQPRYISNVPISVDGNAYPLSGLAYVYIGKPYGSSPDDCNLNNTIQCTGFELFTCLENINDPNRDSVKKTACPYASYTLTAPQ